VTGWNRICCAVDFSEHSRVAMRRAAELARRLGSALTLVHVFSPPAGAEPFITRRHGVLAAASLARNLSEWTVVAADLAGAPVRAEVLSGPAGGEIVRFAGEHDFDVLVMGTAGRTGLKRVLLGSVAEEVVRHAPCPVLVVRSDGEARAAGARAA
jgi:nucleotide-binding universal stress UspA family protein